MSLRKLIAAAVMAGTAACGLAATSQAGEFDGVTVNILTRPGYVIAGRLAERGKEFEAATGGKIVVTEVPFAEIFPKIQNDWSTGTNSIDVGVFAAGWGVELDAAGLLEDMDPYVAKDTKIDMADIAPYFREFGQKVGGKTKLLGLISSTPRTHGSVGPPVGVNVLICPRLVFGFSYKHNWRSSGAQHEPNPTRFAISRPALNLPLKVGASGVK